MWDLRHAELATIAVCATLVAWALLSGTRQGLRERALAWRRDCRLSERDFPGAFRLGVTLTAGLASGFITTAGAALFDMFLS